MEEKIIIILRNKDGNLEAYVINPIDDVLYEDQLLWTCEDCLLGKLKACYRSREDESGNNSDIYFSQESNKFFKKVAERDLLCDDYLFGSYYDFRNYEKIPVPEKFIAKNLDADYGDEDDLSCNSDGIISLTPTELMNTFCKKICPGYKEDLTCIKDLGCPFHDFMNECYKIVEK